MPSTRTQPHTPTPPVPSLLYQDHPHTKRPEMSRTCPIIHHFLASKRKGRRRLHPKKIMVSRLILTPNSFARALNDLKKKRAWKRQTFYGVYGTYKNKKKRKSVLVQRLRNCGSAGGPENVGPTIVRNFPLKLLQYIIIIIIIIIFFGTVL